MYFILKCKAPTDENGGYMDIEDYADIDGFDDWRRGAKATDAPVGRVTINAIPEDGYKGAPRELSDFTIPIMSDRLKTALEEAGVDNIAFYPVDLMNTETGQIYKYHAFNLIGLVSATDLQKSDISSYDGDYIGDSSIKNLVINDSATHGLLMFRLAQKFSAILVHEKVRHFIEKKGIDTLSYIAPEDYYHL